MTFESLHSSGSRLHILVSDILSWKRKIGIAYILFSKDLWGSFQHMKLEKKLRYFRESKIETENQTRESERQRQRDRHDLEPKGHRWRWTVKVEQLKVNGTETGDNTIIWDGVLRNRAQDCRWKQVDEIPVNDTCIKKYQYQ